MLLPDWCIRQHGKEEETRRFRCGTFSGRGTVPILILSIKTATSRGEGASGPAGCMQPEYLSQENRLFIAPPPYSLARALVQKFRRAEHIRYESTSSARYPWASFANDTLVFAMSQAGSQIRDSVPHAWPDT